MAFLSDRKVLIGVGIGIVFATLTMSFYQIDFQMSKPQIESKARGMGMIYPEESKVINSKGVK